MPRPRRSAAIEAELNGAIDAVIAKGMRPNFSNVASEAGRARGLLSRADTAYQEPRNRIIGYAAAPAPPPPDRIAKPAAERPPRPRRVALTDAEVDARLAVASSTIASLMVALAHRKAATGSEGREERLAARERRAMAEAAALQ